MAFVSKINWRSDAPNSAGYYGYLCSGEFSGRCSARELYNKGDMVNVGIEVRFVKEKNTEYTNFKILGKVNTDNQG